MKRLRLCFLIPASPTDGFFGQIAMFRRSLDHLGGIYREARVVAVFGDSTIEPLPARWQPHFDQISVHHVDPADFNARSYLAQGDARWDHVPDDCDIAILCDADTLVIRPFDDLLEQLVEAPGVAGTIAHYPFPQFPGERPADKWASLGREWLGRELPLVYQHTLVQESAPDWRRLCPFYLNFGFVLIPGDLIEPIVSTIRSIARGVAPQLNTPYFAGQVSLALAIEARDTPRHAVDLRYNFPNDPVAEERYPASLHDLRVIHYLRTDHFDRQQIFATPGAFDGFLGLSLTGSERLFQDHVREVTGGRYPF